MALSNAKPLNDNETSQHKELAMSTAQSTSRLLLVEPAEFYANPETMTTNVYQVEEGVSADETFKMALNEFRGFRDMLVENNVAVTTVRGVEGCPDHLFPNWISTHEGREMIIYPMRNDNRRAERTPAIIDFFKSLYDVALDIRDFENKGQFLESTGSLCMDRVNKVAYCGLSGRSDEKLARFWAEQTGYDLEVFETESHAGKPVYHSDLVMFIGTEVIGICAECIKEEHRERVLNRLKQHRTVVELSLEQLQNYCGNSLEVQSVDGDKMLVMSETAYKALRDDQKETYLKYFTKLLHAPIPTIEKYGGGSARCLIMELF